MYHRAESEPLPPFCGFALPLRVSHCDVIFFKKRPTREEELYEEFEKQWESRWTGLVEPKTSFVKAPKSSWRIKSKVFSLLSAKSREPSSDASEDSDGSDTLSVDNFMPPFPKDYKDPAAIY